MSRLKGGTKVRVDRREFLGEVGTSILVATGLTSIVSFLNFGSMYRHKPLWYQSRKIIEMRGGGEEFIIRPPGARGEEDFLSKCIKCHLCVEACPIQAIKITGREAGLSADTPHIIPEVRGCNLCLDRDKMYCNAVCPTNALEKIPVDKEVIFNKMKMGQPLNMGIPILDKRICYPWIGVNACGLCWEICPYTYKGTIVAGDARAFHPANAPNFYPEKCVGCGLCVDVCPLPQKERAIKIVPGRKVEYVQEFMEITPEGKEKRWSFDVDKTKSRARKDERLPEEVSGVEAPRKDDDKWRPSLSPRDIVR